MTEAAPSYRVEIKLNSRGIMAPLTKLLKESTENVSVGLTAIERYSPRFAPIPADYIPLSYGEPDQLRRVPRNEIRRRKENFRIWLLTRGFEECSKAVIASLREAFLYVEIFGLDLNAHATVGELDAAIGSFESTQESSTFLPCWIGSVVV
jgi:hypothetical protein